MERSRKGEEKNKNKKTTIELVEDQEKRRGTCQTRGSGTAYIECSRVMNSLWLYLTSLVTTRIGAELATVQGNYPTVL